MNRLRNLLILGLILFTLNLDLLLTPLQAAAATSSKPKAHVTEKAKRLADKKAAKKAKGKKHHQANSLPSHRGLDQPTR